MKHEIFLRFDNGLPRTTAQEKGETIKYKRIRTQKGVKLVPYIFHFRKPEVEQMRTLFAYKLKPFRPKTPSILPIKIEFFIYFDVNGSHLEIFGYASSQCLACHHRPNDSALLPHHDNEGAHHQLPPAEEHAFAASFSVDW